MKYECDEKIIFTSHALERINERSTLSPIFIEEAINKRKLIVVSVEECTGLISYLLFAELDMNFLVIVFDPKNKEVITVMPISYWNLLQKDKVRYWNRNRINQTHLFSSVKAMNPIHVLVSNPPLCGKKEIHIFLYFSVDNKRLRKWSGSISIDSILNESKNNIKNILQEIILKGVRENLIDGLPSHIIWGVSKKTSSIQDKQNIVEVSYDYKIEDLYRSIFLDIRIRARNTKLYPIFENILENN